MQCTKTALSIYSVAIKGGVDPEENIPPTVNGYWKANITNDSSSIRGGRKFNKPKLSELTEQYENGLTKTPN